MSLPDTARRLLARLLVAGFLTGALLTGGASLEGEVQKAMLFVVAGLTLGGLILLSRDWLSAGAVTALSFALLFVLIVLLQLLPLPAGFTRALPDRDVALAGLQALGEGPASLPLSLSPEATLISLLAVLAPLCGFCLIAAVKWSRGAALLKWVIPLLGAASACLGLAQVIFSGNRDLYPYSFTNIGSPVGFFANANHQASFLLMCLPFVAVLAADLRRDWEGEDRDVALGAGIAAFGLLIITGILGAGSGAGYLMLAPVLLLSVSIALARRKKKTGRSIPVLLVVSALLAVAALVVFSSPRLSGLGYINFEDGPTTRAGMNRVGLEILEQHWVSGTGLGSYSEVYSLYEDPETVWNTYVAHAHNDYLEWLVELGLPGALLLAGFLIWWLMRFAKLWLGSKTDALHLRRAASVACLVPVLHSLVDYPLRTPALAVLAAMCLAMMVVPQKRAGQAEPAAGEGEELRTVTL